MLVTGIAFLLSAFSRLFILDLEADFQKMADEKNKWFYKYQMLSNLYFYESGLTKVLKKMTSKKNVAIYGLDDIGNHLYKVLIRNGFVVNYGIDQGVGKIWEPSVVVYNLQDNLPDAELIIITLDKHKYPQLKKEIISKCGGNCEYLQVLLITAWSSDPRLILH